jgi:CRP/FNR family cyclic AMP-dependent transcriptional regulator
MSNSLRALAHRGVLRRLRKNTVIITEGEVGDSLHIVLSGRLRAYSEGDNGSEITYAFYGPGEYVGEMGLDGGLRSANVETTEASVCVLITRATLERHLAEDPAFAFELLSRVIRIARKATQGMRSMALHNVYGKVKQLLEQESGGELPFVWQPAPSHKEMGYMLGCTAAMVTTVLGDMRRGGYVEVGRRRLELLRPLPLKW